MKEIHVVGAAMMDGGKLLAAQRSAEMGSPLKWEFAGGKVELGETHRQALEREISEELGVRIEVGVHVADGSSIKGDRKIVLHVYEARIMEGRPFPAEHSELRWMDICNLPELDWAEADLPAVRALVEKYINNAD